MRHLPMLVRLQSTVHLSVILSKNAHGTAQPAVIIDDQPVTAWLRDSDTPSASAQQTNCIWVGPLLRNTWPAFYRSRDFLVIITSNSSL